MSQLSSRPASPARLQSAFLSILPRIELHGQVCFRGLKCPHQKEELLAEMVALAWKWFLRLAEQGKDPLDFPSALATFAARAVKAGRRLCGQERAKDVLSPRAQRRRDFVVRTLPAVSTLNGSPLDEALHDNTQTPVPEQVSFRLDFPAWLGSLSRRDRSLALDMALGHHTQELAGAYRVSPARVSQLRRQLHDDWERFCGPDEDRAVATA